MDEKISLYTRQNAKSRYELENKGYMTNKELYVKLHMGVDAPHFIDRYRTFVAMAEHIVPRPKAIAYPIWCTTQKRYCKRPIAGELIYALEVPREEIIFFDGQKWDYVLNYQYCPLNEADERRFNQKLDRLGLGNIVNLFQPKYQRMYEDIKEEIRQSWSRIFDLTNSKAATIEANLWQIRKEWVKHVIQPDEDFFAKVQDMTDINW